MKNKRIFERETLLYSKKYIRNIIILYKKLLV